MAIRSSDKIKHGWVLFRTGHVYSFRYSNFQFDPEPTVIVINTVRGIHPTTGHRHNYLQAINFTYIPRNVRSIFIKKWKKNLKRYNGDVKLSWLDVTRRYPYLMLALRRYILDKGYVTKIVDIKYDNLEDAVIKTFEADYSKRALISAIEKNPGAARLLKEPELIKKIFGG